MHDEFDQTTQRAGADDVLGEVFSALDVIEKNKTSAISFLLRQRNKLKLDFEAAMQKNSDQLKLIGYKKERKPRTTRQRNAPKPAPVANAPTQVASPPTGKRRGRPPGSKNKKK